MTLTRLCFIVGAVLLLFGLAFLWLTYAIGITGNTDQRPIGYFIIFVAIMLFGAGIWARMPPDRR